MSDAYSLLYSNKKNQLTSVPKQSINNINSELEKARSNSPKPQTREICINKGKVAYEKDIEELKQKIELCETLNKQLETSLINTVSGLRNDLELNVNSRLDEQKKFFESVKAENLKNAINDAVKSFNENIKNIASELVKHNDCLNELKSRIQSIEDVL
jgi:ABC-type multidrug transport system ATPase subunit